MQTFFPYADVHATAKCLDYKRLGKQRLEAYQVIRILERLRSNTLDDAVWTVSVPSSWRNHPIVSMWEGHADALKYYFNVISKEWVARGYKHNMGFYLVPKNFVDWPSWVGDFEFHRSHQSNLVRKFPSHYQPMFPDVPDSLPYKWPKA